MNKQNKKDEKRHYTVSDKVLAARRSLGKKRRGMGKDWVTCKVDRDNLIWARHTHGSVNAALENEKHKMIGRESALAAPPRNCDRPECATTKSAQDVWHMEDVGK